ncbi:MAG: HAD family hydrolase [Clostridia bacterium]|nr:HAD family hydrolase [Clostridia bacterium]
MTTFKAAIFDLDGTLLDSIGDLAAAMNDTLASYGFATFPLAHHKSAVGNGIRAYAEKCIPAERNTPEFLDEFVKSVGARYDSHCTETTVPFDGILPLLDFLKSQGVALNVLSNKLDGFAKEMIAHYFSVYGFHSVYGERPGFPKKPAPDVALTIAKECSVSPEEVLFIGDSIYDVMTGNNAGMCSVAAAWGYQSEQMLLEKNPTFLAHSPLEIIEYIKDRS